MPDTLRSYEVPETLLAMALDRELSIPGVRAALFEPGALTPKERMGYVEELKQQVGGGGVGAALVDIATNPLVWLTFITSPAAGSALREGGRIFTGNKYVSGFIMERLPLLYSLGGATMDQMFERTTVSPLMSQVAEGIASLRKESNEVLHPAMARVMQANGLTRGLDAAMYREGTEGWRKAKELSYALNGSLEGWDRDVTEVTTAFLRGKKAKGKGLVERFTVKESQRPRWYQGSLDEVLQRFEGGVELRDAMRQAMNTRLVKTLGKDGDTWTGADTDKIMRIYRGITHPVTSGGVNPNLLEGKALVEELMGPAPMKAIAEGKLSEAEFVDLVRRTVEEPMKGTGGYFPRNLWANRGSVLQESQRMGLRKAQAVVATGSAVTRGTFHRATDPRDLEMIAEMWGPRLTEGFGKALRQSQEIEQKYLGRGSVQGINFRRINAMEGLEKYLRGTEQTYALYGQRPNEMVNVARKDFLKDIDPVELEKVRKSLRLDGGESVADALQEAYAHLKIGVRGEGRTTWGQDMLANTYLPLYLGRQTIEHSATYSAMRNLQGAVSGIMRGPIGGAIRKAGAFGERQVEKMLDWAETPYTPGRAKSAAGALSSYLYPAHLGFPNVGAVVLNSTQPWILAAGTLGVPSILKGYTQAFKEMGGYLASRAKEGFRPLTDVDRNKRIEKYFEWANVEGRDLIGVKKGYAEMLDNVSNSGSSLGRAGAKESIWLEYPMKLFEKMEVINRSVVAHAIKDQMEKAGLNLTRGSDDYWRLMANVERGVGESQFGGTTGNTPAAFLGQGPLGRVLNNPLGRMFLPFGVRSVTGAAIMPGRIAEGKRQISAFGMPLFQTNTRLASTLADNLRMIGISAIVYEAGKNILGADLSRGLYASSLTSLVGGERFLEGDDWIPIPPAADIPIDLARGVLGGDYELIQRTLPRTVPGGVGLAKLMGSMPQLPPALNVMQRQFVDWKNPTPDGKVSMYKADGTMIGQFPASEVALRGFGLDGGKYENQAEMDSALVKQGETIKNYRRQAVGSLLANDMSGFERTRREFRRRFGFDLQITPDQLKRAGELRTVPRRERIFNTLPPAAREQMAAMGMAPPTPTQGTPPPPYQQAIRTPKEQMGAAARASFDSFTGY